MRDRPPVDECEPVHPVDKNGLRAPHEQLHMANAGTPTLEDVDVDVDGMRAYLEESSVTFAVLFGSRVTGAADDSSDVDVALGFPDEMGARERFRARNRTTRLSRSTPTGSWT